MQYFSDTVFPGSRSNESIELVRINPNAYLGRALREEANNFGRADGLLVLHHWLVEADFFPNVSHAEFQYSSRNSIVSRRSRFEFLLQSIVN